MVSVEVTNLAALLAGFRFHDLTPTNRVLNETVRPSFFRIELRILFTVSLLSSAP